MRPDVSGVIYLVLSAGEDHLLTKAKSLFGKEKFRKVMERQMDRAEFLVRRLQGPLSPPTFSMFAKSTVPGCAFCDKQQSSRSLAV